MYRELDIYRVRGTGFSSNWVTAKALRIGTIPGIVDAILHLRVGETVDTSLSLKAEEQV